MTIGTGPGYWQYEISGTLRPAIEAYLRQEPLAATDITLIRAYLRQWIMAPVWRGPMIEELRAWVDGLDSRAAIRDWLAVADEMGLDPL